MRPIRRNDYAPRVDMLPLIDVTFLLLTFFIFAMITMRQAEILPVTLTPIERSEGGQSPALRVVTIDKAGDLYWNRRPVTFEQLDQHLAELAADPDRPMLYLAIEADGERDRLPMVPKLMQHIIEAGVTNFAFVGDPARASDSDPATDGTRDAPTPSAAN